MLERKAGGFEYLTALIDDAGDEKLSLPDLLRSRVIEDYGKENLISKILQPAEANGQVAVRWRQRRRAGGRGGCRGESAG